MSSVRFCPFIACLAIFRPGIASLQKAIVAFFKPVSFLYLFIPQIRVMSPVCLETLFPFAMTSTLTKKKTRMIGDQ